MDITLIVALVGAIVTALGWLVTHLLSTSSEERLRRLIYQRKFIRRQLDELYGPLAFLLLEGRQTFQALADTLGRDQLKDEDVDFFSEQELKAWLFWIDADFFPRNEKIKELLSKKTHLIEGGEVPQSFLTFLDHHNSWKINHERWLKQGIKYGWRSKINWPDQFEEDVICTFKELKKRHAILMGQISEDKKFIARIGSVIKNKFKQPPFESKESLSPNF